MCCMLLFVVHIVTCCVPVLVYSCLEGINWYCFHWYSGDLSARLSGHGSLHRRVARETAKVYVSRDLVDGPCEDFQTPGAVWENG